MMCKEIWISWRELNRKYFSFWTSIGSSMRTSRPTTLKVNLLKIIYILNIIILTN